MTFSNATATELAEEVSPSAASRAVPSRRPLPSAVKPWGHLLPLFLILAVGAFLRFHNLTARGLWMDEGVSAAIARLSWDNFIRLLEWREGNMSIYYFLLRGWARFGFSEFHLRSLSVLFGALTVLAIYYLGRELYGRAAGLMAAVILALHPFHIHYSQEARSYALLGLTLTLAAYFLVRTLRGGSETHCLGFVVFATLSIYAHFFAVLCLFSFLCAALLFPDRKAKSRNLLGGVALLALLALPGMQYAWGHRNIELIDWIPAPSIALLARCATTLLGPPGLLGLACFLAILALFLAARTDARSVSGAGWRRALLPILWALLPGLILLAVSFRKPVLFDRYLLMCVPGSALLGACVFHRLRDAWRPVFAALIVLAAAISLPASYRLLASDTEDWRGAVGYAIRNSGPDDVVLLDNGIARPIFEYYRLRFNAAAPRVHSFGPRSEELNFADFAGITPPAVVGRMARTRDRVWIFEWGPANPLVPEMERYFRRERAQAYAHVKVSLYVRDSSAHLSQ